MPPFSEEGDYYDVFQNYVIRTKDRDALVKHLENNGIEVLVKWAIPNYKQEALKDFHQFNLAKTDQISDEVISLPMYPELTNDQIDYVTEKVKEFFK